MMPESEDYWVILERDGVEIHLVPKDWPAGALILVDSVDRMVEELQARGARFESGPTDQEYGWRDFAVSDPNGFQIGFWQPLPPMSFRDKVFPHRPKVDPSLPEDEQPF
jgi:catechol 2,3-dioxygenase-like lactoylglutathione lyase family enzyme